MHKPTRAEELKRIGAESADQIRNAQASCEDGRNHIKWSREAIARSLEVLAQTASKIGD